MAEESLPEAKIKVTIDADGAMREQDRLEREKDRAAKQGRQKRVQDDKKAAKKGGGAFRTGLAVGGAALRGDAAGALNKTGSSRAAKFAGAALVITGVVEAVEHLLPIISERFKQNLPPMLREAVGEPIDDALDFLSDEITDLKAKFTSLLPTLTGTGDAMRAKLLLGGELNATETLDFARDLRQVIEADNRAAREQGKLTKHLIAETAAGIFGFNWEG